jgi:hypothetical protein
MQNGHFWPAAPLDRVLHVKWLFQAGQPSFRRQPGPRWLFEVCGAPVPAGRLMRNGHFKRWEAQFSWEASRKMVRSGLERPRFRRHMAAWLFRALGNSDSARMKQQFQALGSPVFWGKPCQSACLRPWAAQPLRAALRGMAIAGMGPAFFGEWPRQASGQPFLQMLQAQWQTWVVAAAFFPMGRMGNGCYRLGESKALLEALRQQPSLPFPPLPFPFVPSSPFHPPLTFSP